MSDIEQISESFATITTAEVEKAFQEEIETLSPIMGELMQNIRFLIDKLIANMEIYESKQKLLSQEKNISSVILQEKKLKLQKELIYEDFFKLQNLINLFISYFSLIHLLTLTYFLLQYH